MIISGPSASPRNGIPNAVSIRHPREVEPFYPNLPTPDFVIAKKQKATVCEVTEAPIDYQGLIERPNDLHVEDAEPYF